MYKFCAQGINSFYISANPFNTIDTWNEFQMESNLLIFFCKTRWYSEIHEKKLNKNSLREKYEWKLNLFHCNVYNYKVSFIFDEIVRR